MYLVIAKVLKILWSSQDEVNALITQLRNCRGPRLLHAHKLKNLLYDIKVLYIHLIVVTWAGGFCQTCTPESQGTQA